MSIKDLARKSGSPGSIFLSTNYFAVSLRAGQRWRYEPPANHSILWLASGKGRIRTLEPVGHGEIAIFDYGARAVEFVADEDSEFVTGSATPHPHDLVLGHYSVHTSDHALQQGEAHIARLRDELMGNGPIAAG